MLLFLLSISSGHAQQQNGPVAIIGMETLIESIRDMNVRLDALLQPKWEYRFVQRNLLSDVRADLKALGREGWEVVSITQEEGFLLKRRVF